MKAIMYVLMALVVMGGAMAASEDVSFVVPFAGVDDDTSGWSTDDSMVNLGVSELSLISSLGTLTGYDAAGLGILTQRGTRGLGVSGLEEDEIGKMVPPPVPESIEIEFDEAVELTYVEVRSLFFEDGHAEEGDIDFYLEGNLVYNEHLVGVELPGTNGELGFDYDGIAVDKLVFHVKDGEDYSEWSEFAVAKLEVETDPEIPEFSILAGVMALIGGLTGFMLLRKH